MPDRRSLAYAALAAAVVLGWQAATVRVNYGGNWTALFCTGARNGVPPSLAAEHIYQFPHSSGFDGQMYHYVAHDPRVRTPDLKNYVDAPGLRYRRILVPGLAYLLAAGHASWIDRAYYAVILLSIAAGVYWSASFCRAHNCAAAWGLLFALLPAALIAMDRMAIDVSLAALAAAFACYARTPSWRLFLVLAAAPLARETGFLLPAAYCLHLTLERRFRQAAVWSLAIVPTLVWYWYVGSHVPYRGYEFNMIPLSAVWTNWLHPFAYPSAMRFRWLVVLGDRLALVGMLAAFALAIYWLLRRRPDPLSLATLFFVALGVLFQKNENWAQVYDYGRVYSPVLLFLGFEGCTRRAAIALAPLGLILPRIGMQLWSQIQGVLTAAFQLSILNSTR